MLTKDEKDLLEEIKRTDGAEIPKPYWEITESLRDKGRITLTGPRGPGGFFKRAEPID